MKDVAFELTHVKLRTTTSQSHGLVFCAASRVVKEEPIRGKIAGLHGKIADVTGDFVYVCYISSPLLDSAARNERTGFDLEDDVTGLFSDSTISMNDIRAAVLSRAEAHLGAFLDEGRRLGRERVSNFVDNKAPRYRPMVHRMADIDVAVDPSISDKDLEMMLHKSYAEIEREMLSAGHDMLRKIDLEDVANYESELQSYMSGLVDLKKSDLANYVSHRRVILDILQKALEKKEDGRYLKEDLIHSLFIPMRVDSTEILYDEMNLWLLDERLAFHNYLASDKPLASMKVTSNTSGKEPDVLVLSVADNPMAVSESGASRAGSITLVEFKRPMRNDGSPGEQKDPIEQVLGYLRRIREGSVTTAQGRPIMNAAEMPAYCYVIADLTPTVVERCKLHQLDEMPGSIGYFGYHRNYKTHIEVVSFDGLLQASKQRHRAFFDKLGIPTS